MSRSRISAEFFQGEVVWATLTREAKARIGAAALERVVAQAIFEADYGKGPAGRAAEAALELADRELQAVAIGDLGGDLWVERVGSEAAYRIPSVLGLVCNVCGCSEHDACEPARGWTSDTMCSACQGDARVSG